MNCPRCHKQALKILTVSDQWECGYCKRKGNAKDLVRWILDIKLGRIFDSLRGMAKSSKNPEERQGYRKPKRKPEKRLLIKCLWDVGDLNSRPHACEACALNQLS
jgi:hypothetical protein